MPIKGFRLLFYGTSLIIAHNSFVNDKTIIEFVHDISNLGQNFILNDVNAFSSKYLDLSMFDF